MITAKSIQLVYAAGMFGVSTNHDLSNKIICRPRKSRETILLNVYRYRYCYNFVKRYKNKKRPGPFSK